MNLLIALLAGFAPLAEWKSECDFYLNLPARMQVVEMVKNNKLERPYDYNRELCTLPFWLKGLSKGGGDIVVTDGTTSTSKVNPSRLHIFFFTYRGVLDRYSGFEYSADDKPPVSSSKAKQVLHLQTNWYWATV